MEVVEQIETPPRLKKGETAGEVIQQVDERSTLDWLQGLGGSGPMQVRVSRHEPKIWKGHTTGGYCGTFDEPIDEQKIQALYGGGKYDIKVFQPKPKGGGYCQTAMRRLEIAGEPKINTEVSPTFDSSAASNSGGGGGGNGGTDRVLSTMERITSESQRRAEALEKEIRQGSNMSGDMLKILTDTVSRQSPNDRILEKMIDGESARIEAIRTQHDSELRQLRQSNNDEIKMLREHGHQDAQLREKAHEREIANMRETNAMQIENMKQTFEGRIDSFKARQSDLERQLTESKAEIGELKAKKDKGPVESMQEVMALKEALEAFGGGGGEEEDSTWKTVLQQLVEKVGAPIASAAASRVEAAPPAPRPVARRPQPQPRPVAAVLPAKPQRLPLKPDEAAGAVAFMETALRNGTDPVAFATSAKSMVPAAIINFVKARGIDTFLTAAKVDENSPLMTQAGKNWVRSVAKSITDSAPTP